tara:strand:- start:293 stop:574 length:282 start_codon:yes stop_codon:yes gene_type:complete
MAKVAGPERRSKSVQNLRRELQVTRKEAERLQATLTYVFQRYSYFAVKYAQLLDALDAQEKEELLAQALRSQPEELDPVEDFGHFGEMGMNEE